MVEFLYHTEEGWEETYDQDEASHVRLPVEEYEDLLDRRYIPQTVDSLILAAKVTTAGKAENETGTDKSDVQIRELERKLTTARQELDYEKNLNENFRRIFKEKSNAARKIKPKKEHTGYVIISTTEKEKYSYANKKGIAISFWETIMQTPYTSQLTVEQVKKETLELTNKQSDGTALINRIGIGGLYGKGLDTLMKLPESEKNQLRNENVVLSRLFKFNARSRYWEISITHLRPLTCFDEMMMRPGRKTDENDVQSPVSEDKTCQ